MNQRNVSKEYNKTKKIAVNNIIKFYAILLFEVNYLFTMSKWGRYYILMNQQ